MDDRNRPARSRAARRRRRPPLAALTAAATVAAAPWLAVAPARTAGAAPPAAKPAAKRAPTINDADVPDGAGELLAAQIPPEVSQLIEALIEQKSHGAMHGGPLTALGWAKPPKEDVAQSLAASLKKLGYAVDVQPLPSTDGGEARSLLAVSAAAGHAYLGVWIRKDPVQMFAWREMLKNAPAAGKAVTAPVPPAGAAPAKAVAFPAMAPKPGTVRGVVLNRAGKPLEGVKVSAFVGDVEDYVHYNRGVNVVGTTDAAGRYALDIHELPGVARVHAAWLVRYHGAPYQVPLMMVGANGKPRENDIASKEKGDVFHFTPVLTGLRPGADPNNQFSYYGAALTVSHDIASTFRALPPGSRLAVTLTPDGPLVDGSAGKPLTRVFPNVYGGSWPDIPLGAYRVAAAAVLPDGRQVPLATRLAVETVTSRRVVPLDANTPLIFGTMTTPGLGSTGDYHAELMVVVP